MKKGFLHYATNDVYSVKSTVVEIPHFLPDYVVQAGVRKDKWSQEAGIWEPQHHVISTIGRNLKVKNRH